MRLLLVLAALATAGPLFAGVVINEIHYNPDPGADTAYEFFELHNPGPAAQDLAGWSMSAGVVHTFAAGTSIPAGGYLVVAKLASTYTGEFGLANVVQWTSGDLNNGGETLSISDASGTLVDSVPYDDGGCWVLSPDGEGPSLELVSPSLDNSLCASWSASTVDYGTPGAQNSVYVAPGGPPVISAVGHSPVAPSFSDEVLVSASLTDEGDVVLAHVEYTVDGGTSHTVGMLEQAGDLWSATLPAQPAGSEVAYRVVAFDDDGESSQGAWQSYSVAAGTVAIVINELHYNGPETGTDVTEFIELHNAGTASVNLQGWTLSGVTYTFPSSRILAPGAYLVLAGNASGFQASYGFAPDVVWSSGALSNDGEAVVLTNAAGQEMDRVAYDDASPWPTTPDGFGPSLELIDPSLDNNVAASWQASLVDGGTPGAANSAPTVDAEERTGAFALQAAWPNPFNPMTHLAFQLSQAQTVELAIYDVAGRRVALLADGLRAAGPYEVVFDGSGLASGLYLACLRGEAGTVAVQRLLLVK